MKNLSETIAKEIVQAGSCCGSSSCGKETASDNRGQARDIYLCSKNGLDVRDRYYLDNCIIIKETIGRNVMFNSYISNTLKYDSKLCTNCGMCSTVCSHGVFSPNGKVVQLLNPSACMECGACQLNCPTKAIKVDSGVGCAYGMMWAAARGQKEVTCGSDCCDSKPQVLQIGKKE